MPATLEQQNDIFEALLFRDLLAQKVEIRGPCPHCKGEGEKNGDVCSVCNGERQLTQPVNLYKLAKMLLPVIAMELAKRKEEE